MDIPPDVSPLAERLQVLDPAFLTLLEKVDIRAAATLEQDRRGLIDDDLLHFHGQSLDLTLVDAE